MLHEVTCLSPPPATQPPPRGTGEWEGEKALGERQKAQEPASANGAPWRSKPKITQPFQPTALLLCCPSAVPLGMPRKPQSGCEEAAGCFCVRGKRVEESKPGPRGEGKSQPRHRTHSFTKNKLSQRPICCLVRGPAYRGAPRMGLYVYLQCPSRTRLQTPTDAIHVRRPLEKSHCTCQGPDSALQGSVPRTKWQSLDACENNKDSHSSLLPEMPRENGLAFCVGLKVTRLDPL